MATKKSSSGKSSTKTTGARAGSVTSRSGKSGATNISRTARSR